MSAFKSPSAQSSPPQTSMPGLRPKRTSPRRASPTPIPAPYRTPDESRPGLMLRPETSTQPSRSPEEPSETPLRATSTLNNEPAPRRLSNHEAPSASTTPTPTKHHSQSLISKTAAAICKKLNLKNTRPKTGFVYVVRATHNGNPIVKIGHTVEPTVSDRIKPLQSKCRDIQFHPPLATDPPGQHVPTYYRQVETLAHNELETHRYHFTCGCGTQHREYFAVAPAAAHAAVQRWARFCWEKAPYDAAGSADDDDDDGATLADEWRDRLEAFCKSAAALGGGGGCTTALAAAAWERFVGAGWRDWVRYDLRRFVLSETCLLLAGLFAVWLAWYGVLFAAVAKRLVVVWFVCRLMGANGFRFVAGERAIRERVGPRGGALAADVAALCALVVGLEVVMGLDGLRRWQEQAVMF